MFLYGKSEWESSPYNLSNAKKYYPSSVFSEEVEMIYGSPEIIVDETRCIDWIDYWGGFNGQSSIFPGNTNSQPYIWTNSSNVTTDNRLIRCNAFKSTECKCCTGLTTVMNSAKNNGTTNAKKYHTTPSSKLPTLTQLSNISSVMPTKLNTSNRYALLSEIVPIGTYSLNWGGNGLNISLSCSNSSSGVYIRLETTGFANRYPYEFYINNMTFGFDMSFTYEDSQDETLYSEDFEWLVQNVFNGTTGSSYTYTYSYSYSGPTSGNGILSFSATESEIIRYANDITDNHLDPLLRNYTTSTTNTIFTNLASVGLPYVIDDIGFNIDALLFGVCLYNLRIHDASRYAQNGNYNYYSQGKDVQPGTSGLEGECITLIFKSVGAAGHVNFHFLLRSISIGISPFENFYLELTPLHLSGSSSPFTIDDWTIVPARNIRTFTNASEITLSLTTTSPAWKGEGDGLWVKPNIHIVYNGNSYCDLTPGTINTSGLNITSQTITINGAGNSSIPVYLYKTPQITSS